jgi:Tfp pilus assembly protein PilF
VAVDNRGYFQKGYDYVAGSMKSAFGSDKVTEKPVARPDAISLSKPSEPDANLCVKLAALAERSGNVPGAEKQYQRALQLDPHHVDALLGYARLHDTQKRFDHAMRLYQDAARKHPQNATIRNDLGLCLARQRNLDGAIAELTRAVQLQPDKVLYRNNLSTVLVQRGLVEEAFKHLAHVHPPAAAHYNLGFLLRQQGNEPAAREQFARAVQIDPNFAPAREYLAELSPPGSVVAQSPQGMGVARPAAHQQPMGPRFGR